MRFLYVPSILIGLIGLIVNLVMLPTIKNEDWGTMGFVFLIILIVITAGVYSGLILSRLLQKSANRFSSKDNFIFDINVVNYFFMMFIFVYFLAERNNSDLRGWWCITEFIMVLVGIVYAYIYALIGMLMREHRKYTIIFSTILFLLFVTCIHLSKIMPIFSMHQITDPVYIVPLMVHLIISFSRRFVENNR